MVIRTILFVVKRNDYYLKRYKKKTKHNSYAHCIVQNHWTILFQMKIVTFNSTSYNSVSFLQIISVDGVRFILSYSYQYNNIVYDAYKDGGEQCYHYYSCWTSTTVTYIMLHHKLLKNDS